MKALAYAYRDRRARKGDMRRLWIQRINAAARQHGMSYSVFMAALKERGVTLTARCWPTSPCAIPPRSGRWSRLTSASSGRRSSPP